jgi:hypothetical protein
MGYLGCRLARNLAVSGVGANLDVLGPSDLSKMTDVNRAKECLVRERRKYPAPNVASKVDDALHAVRIRQAKTVFRKRFDFVWSVYAEKMPLVFRSASRELSEGGGWRDGCGGEGGGVVSVTVVAVRCSAWLGDGWIREDVRVRVIGLVPGVA